MLCGAVLGCADGFLGGETVKNHKRLGLAFVALTVLLAPSLVGAHSATGPCADCHTMHNSQDGVEENAAGPQLNLLKLSCIGCHARTFNGADGRASSIGGPAAPQVGPAAAPPAGSQISGGYFSTAADANTHNVSDIPSTAPDAIMLLKTTSAPGGTFALQSGTSPKLRCVSCHDPAIRHASAGTVRSGTASSSYRMLHGTTGNQYVKGTGDSNFEAGAGQNQYDAASMNLFCANCHGLFHGLAGNGSSGAWLRHPTDVTTNPYGANYSGTDKVVPVGSASIIADVDKNQVMCISCHRAHGNARPDMLRFNYNVTDNVAGDVTASQGCETCHSDK